MPPHQLSTLKLLLPCSASPAPLLLQKNAAAFSLSISRTLSSTIRCPLNHYPFIISSYSTPRGRRFPGGGGRRSGGGSAGGDRRGGNGGGSGSGRGRGGLFQQRRGSSTLRERRMTEEERTEGKEGDGFGFNKRRAEGRDKSAKPKELQLKNRKLNPVNTICYAQIMGTGMDTQDTSPSVLLFFDKQRFIFNAGEGMQRFCTEHKIKLSKIDHMFFTRVCSETAGGLPGLLLTLAGIGDEGMAVNIWGPSDLNYLVDAMRSFIPRSAMVHTHSFGVSQDDNEAAFPGSETGKSSNPIILVDDEVVRILAIPIKPNYQNGSSVKPGDIAVIYACELPEIKGKFDPVKAAALGLRPGPKYRELQLGKSVKSDLLDIMVNPDDVLGPSFPGPVMLLIDCPTHSHMLELLSSQSLNRYNCDSTNKLLDEKKVVSCIIHLGPASVTKSSDYQNWMKRFGDAQHIMAGHEIKNMEIPILKSSARIQSRLNYLCPQLFPVPGCWSSQQITNPSSQLTEPPEGSSTSYEGFSAANLLKFHLRPYSHLGLDRSIVPSTLTHEEIISELLSEIPEIVDVAKQINQFWANSMTSKPFKVSEGNSVGMTEEPWLNVNPVGVTVSTNMEKRRKVSSEDDMEKIWHDIPACLQNITREEMEIVLLGTGSSQPSKYRNVSSILINLFSRGSLLLDCGEGTLAQLKRRFGVKGADDMLKGLKCIWISHIHADHHAGLARILALRCQLLKDVEHEPVLVIGPRPLKRFLDAYSMLEDLDMQFLDCRHTLEASMNASLSNDSSNECSTETQEKNSKIESTLFSQSSRMQRYWERPGSPVSIGAALPILKRLKETLTQAGLEALYSVPVVHCPQAFAVVLKAKERTNSTGKAIPGWKLVYSGDTRPCQALIDASLDATILIHEATFEESLKDEAIAKNHSTTTEAIGVGTSAGAYRVILTHFSQRYPKIPVFDEIDHKTCIAFDLMTVNLVDLPVLPKFLPYLKLLFRNDMVIDESEDVQESVLY